MVPLGAPPLPALILSPLRPNRRSRLYGTALGKVAAVRDPLARKRRQPKCVQPGGFLPAARRRPKGRPCRGQSFAQWRRKPRCSRQEPFRPALDGSSFSGDRKPFFQLIRLRARAHGRAFGVSRIGGDGGGAQGRRGGEHPFTLVLPLWGHFNSRNNGSYGAATVEWFGRRKWRRRRRRRVEAGWWWE